MTKAALLAPSLLILTLAGCTGSGGDGGGEDDASGDGGSGAGLSGSTACLIDKDWNLDIADTSQQLAEELAAKGLDVVSSEGEGVQQIFFDQEGFAGSNTAVSYTFTVNMDEGMVMTMVQTHEGDPGGEWAWLAEEENTLVFSDWESDRYTVTTEVSINGSASPPSVVPGGGPGGGTMTIDCDGDSLTTKAEGSPFTQHWTAG